MIILLCSLFFLIGIIIGTFIGIKFTIHCAEILNDDEVNSLIIERGIDEKRHTRKAV